MADRTRIGIIGTSWWTSLMYLPALKSHADAEIAAICGRDAERTKALAQQHGIPRVYGDYWEMLSEGGLDGVIVSTPDDQHRAMTLAVIEAGLPVLCEKPMALSGAEAAQMYDAARMADIRHMVMFTWRWQPCFQYLKALVDEGFVGKLYRAQFSYNSGSWRDDRYEWRRDGARANGILGDVGSHMIDMARWVLGDEIVAVSADAPNLMHRTALDGRQPNTDAAHLTVRFRGGAQGIIDAMALAHLGDNAFRIVARLDGAEGSIEVLLAPLGSAPDMRIRAVRGDDRLVRELQIPERYLAGHDPADALAIYRRNPVGARLFVDAIRGGFQPEPGFDAGLAVQRVIDAALQSHSERRWVDVIS